jgi:hypothetical protein
MFKKNLFICAFFLIVVAGLCWAGGRKDNVSKSSEDLSGVSDTLDISEKKPGKWNYYIEATDKAGNVTLAGPDNMYIDPASDLPGTIIINPLPYMVVQGNMNIVGIAFDDDGVKSVEVAVYRGTNGKGEELIHVTASGTDYWSYFLDTSDTEIWRDGDYTVKTWATDIHDLSGIADVYPNGAKVPARSKKISTMYWKLDRKKPDIQIKSHEVGALVAGGIHFRGTVYDGNGISSMSYSVDGGNKYIPTKFGKAGRDGTNSWDINLNTKQFDDGPVVIWLKSRDTNGSEGVAAHLLFVNNTAPDVKIVYPEQNSVVNGIFSIAGFAKHPVGLRSVTWKAGAQQGEFELLPGNQWWSATVDARAFKGNTINVEIRAVDVSGNTTVVNHKYKMDQAADRPVVTLESPVPGVLDSKLGILVKGTAVDNQGVAAVLYSLNGSQADEIPCNGPFQFVIPTPADGSYTLDVWAKDITGITGVKTQVKGITVSNAVIQPGIVSVSWPEGKATANEAFQTGMKIRPVAKMNMVVSFQTPVAPKTASIQFGRYQPVPLKLVPGKGAFTATVPVPAISEEGLLEIVLTAVDRLDKTFTFSEYVYVTQTGAVDYALTWVRPATLEDGRILLKEGETLMGISPVPLTSAAIQGSGSNLLSATIDQLGRVLVTASDGGETGSLTLNLGVEGGSFQSGQFSVVAETTGPVVTMRNSEDYRWVRNSVQAAFSVSSRIRVSSVDVSYDLGNTWQSLLSASELSALRGPVNSSFTQNLDLSSLDDGSINILIRAVSASGLESTAGFTVLKDNAPPQALTIMPIAEAGVNGTIRMAFAAEEAGAIQSITYRRNANSPAREVYNDSLWQNDFSPRFFEILMDAADMPLDNNMRFTFTDKAGNSSEINTWEFIIDREMDIPKVQLVLPVDNEVIASDFIVSGVMFDDDEIKGFQWRIDNNPWRTEEAKYGFSIPIALLSMTDNEHTVTVVAEDIYGVRSEPATRKFRVSLNEPTATMTFPLFDAVLKEGVQLLGTASDKNGIKEVGISIDNGNSFNAARGRFGTDAETAQWNYQFNTTILKDGPHVVFVRVKDRYDIPSTYAFMINIDNTDPEIIIESPGDGSITVGNISVMGRVLDPNLEEARIELRSLDGFTIPADLRSRKLDVNSMVRENLNISAMQDGQYNIAIIATDRAGNVSRSSRNVQMARQTFKNYIEILYPLENEETSGEFNLYGFAGGANPAGTVTMRINGADGDTVPVDVSGYFVFKLDAEKLTAGANAISVDSNFGGGTLVSSRAYNINYRDSGPWVTIDSFTFAQFAYERPYLYGRTGYVLSEEDRALLEDKNTDKELRAEITRKAPDFTEISFDNGRTFKRMLKAAAKDIDYRYRLEDGEMPEGFHYILIRTTMKNGELAMTRMMVQVDKTKPVIRLISPEPGNRYNEEIVYSASASDDNEMASLTYHLRIGDKAFYEIPGFLQGLYFEAIIPPFFRQIAVMNDAAFIMPSMPFSGGVTYTDFGMGLSFFDDNVKVQVQYGFMTQELYESLGGKDPVRYGGDVLGIKLLANLYNLPLAPYWGPDFEWLSASFSIGANFSLFNIANKENPGYSPDSKGDPVYYTQSGTPTWMSALLLQIEFPKVTIPKKKYLRTFSLFTEGQLWFVPTDVNAEKMGIETVIPHITMGLRAYIF